MMIICGIGFYYFIKIPRPREPPLMLDVVLLVVCVLGPIIQDLFTLLAVIDGKDNKVNGWGITVVAPLMDILECIFQVRIYIKSTNAECK